MAITPTAHLSVPFENARRAYYADKFSGDLSRKLSGTVSPISNIEVTASRGLNSGHIYMGLTCSCLSTQPSLQKGDFVLEQAEEPTEAEREPDPVLDTPSFPNLDDYLNEAKDGVVYQGAAKAGLPHGKGRSVEADGTVYVGEFLAGQKHGSGQETMLTGEVYVGDFEENCRQGQGICKYADGRTYEGRWEGGRETGNGTMQWSDGRRYTGGLVNGFKSGFGVFEWGDGRKYAGAWLRDVQHGEGVFTTSDGDSVRGTWVQGKRVYH